MLCGISPGNFRASPRERGLLGVYLYLLWRRIPNLILVASLSHRLLPYFLPTTRADKTLIMLLILSHQIAHFSQSLTEVNLHSLLGRLISIVKNDSFALSSTFENVLLTQRHARHYINELFVTSVVHLKFLFFQI